MSVDNEGKMTVVVNAPEDLSGMKLTYSGDGVTADYMGLTYTPNTGTMPIGGISQTVYDVLESIRKNNFTADADGDNCKVEGKADGRAYSFCFSPTGLPLSLELPSDSFRIDFSNVTILNI